MSGSAFYERAAEQTRALSDAHHKYLQEHIAQATDATSGHLLNARGEYVGVEPRLLFTGPGVALRARAYASDPLNTFWVDTPRLTLRAFERLWLPTQSPAYTVGVYWGRREVAAFIDVKPDTLSRYALPQPDAYIGDVRGWSPSTIQEWHAARPRGPRR